MNQSANALYTLNEKDGSFSFYVLCNIIDDTREHVWIGQGSTKELAMDDLQAQMRVAK